MTRIAVTGLACVDFLFSVPEMPNRAEKYQASAVKPVGGGGGANASVALHRLGADVQFFSRIGDDDIAEMILKDLAREGLDLRHIHRSIGGASSCSSVLLDAAGERQIVNFRGAGLPDDPAWMDLSQSFDAALADTRWQAGARLLLQTARTRGVPGVLDGEAPVHGDVAMAASHVAFSEQGLRDFTGQNDAMDGLATAASRLPGWVCVTLGSGGVAFMDGGAMHRVPAFPITVIDSLGAGDVWHAGFTLRLAEGADERTAIRFANAAAALKCQTHGGRAGAPGRAETEAFLAQNPG